MSDLEEYKKALKIVKIFEGERNKNFITDYTCCVCQINKIYPINPETIEPLKQQKGMWSNGLVELVQPGYGSIHDLEQFFIAICDDCIGDLNKTDISKNYRKIRRDVTHKIK